jgi:hypothetical protein
VDWNIRTLDHAFGWDCGRLAEEKLALPTIGFMSNRLASPQLRNISE